MFIVLLLLGAGSFALGTVGFLVFQFLNIRDAVREEVDEVVIIKRMFCLSVFSIIAVVSLLEIGIIVLLRVFKYIQ